MTGPGVTAETVTDEQIAAARAREVDDPVFDRMCRVALQHGTPTGMHPYCRVCGWRKGGVDSWDGKTCKCKLRAEAYHRCSTCAGLGTVPYDLGSQACPSCDGSGLVSPGEIAAARVIIAAAINARAKAAANV